MEKLTSALAPSRGSGTTVYVSNLPFTLTNNDLHKVFEQHGKIVKVTILKDEKRRSRGVAFVQFLRTEDATQCAAAVDTVQMFGRTLKASLAKDNGRSGEFNKKRKYTEKQRCYECGSVDGHLSYKCPVNVLGSRDPPPRKIRKLPKDKTTESLANDGEQNDDDEEEAATGLLASSSCIAKKKRYKKSNYLSDEEVLSE